MTRSSSQAPQRCLPIALATLALLFAATSASADDRDEFSWTVDPDVRVDVEIVQGKIEIRGWDQDEVRVRAKGGGVEALDVDAGEGWVSIRLPGRRGVFGFGRGGVDVDLEIHVPEDADIHARTINGPIELKDVRGLVSLQSANGKIEVKGEPIDARLETVSSSIEFEGRRSSVDARTVSGSITLKGVAGEVAASSMSGAIQVEGGTVDRIDVKSMSGSIDFRGALAPDGRARFKSYSGSVKLELPKETSARFDVQNFSGSLDSDFVSGDREHRRRRGPGHSTRFETGDGAGRIDVESFSGSVKIEARN